MKLQVVTYNMEWMRRLFHTDGTPKGPSEPSADDQREAARSVQMATVVRTIEPDILLVVEGPDTLADGSKTATQQLEAWRDLHGLDPDYRAVTGITSGGAQELCALFKQTKVNLAHQPEGEKSKHPFGDSFLVDTTESLIKEQYRHYRPPLELSIREPGSGGAELARAIVVHTKSKGIFESVDLARFEQLSERNRKKLYAECYSIRERCDQWLKTNGALKLIVAGDVNDGFGVDYYERRFSKSAVEILLGDVWRPEWILKHVLPQPRLGRYGWSPASSRFRDRITEDDFNVLIDHLLVCNIEVEDAKVWNPYERNAPPDVKALKDSLTSASDHFPVSAVLTL